MKEQQISAIRKGGLYIGGGIAAWAIACGGGNGTEPNAQRGDTPTLPAATETLKSSPTPPLTVPTATLEPTIEPTSAMDCGVLQGKDCLSAEAHSRPVPGGQENYAAFHLAKGIPVFSPFDGEIFAAFTPPSGPGDFPQGATLMQVRSQDGNSAVNIMGSIESKVNKGDVVHKGQVIAVSAQTLPGSPKDYTMAVMFLEKSSAGGMIQNEQLFKTFFPNIPY